MKEQQLVFLIPKHKAGGGYVHLRKPGSETDAICGLSSPDFMPSVEPDRVAFCPKCRELLWQMIRLHQR
ncbi:MAG: hypothetical protein OXE75_05830 [bacterium]|nr:hypothetical protein [bacterium]